MNKSRAQEKVERKRKLANRRRQQPASFLEEAIIDGDGTMAETTGECKQGMDINHKGQWRYQPLVVSLANTAEPLYLVNTATVGKFLACQTAVAT